MKRTLNLESWSISDDSDHNDREYSHPTFEDVTNELKSFTAERKVGLYDKLELSIEYSNCLGIIFEVGNNSLQYKPDTGIDEDLILRFLYFFESDFESLLKCPWDALLGYEPITIELIKHAIQDTGS